MYTKRKRKRIRIPGEDEPEEDEPEVQQDRKYRLLQMALVNEKKETTRLEDLVRTAAQQKTDLETVIEQQAADNRRTEVLAGELAAGKLQAEDRLEQQTLRFAYAQTKKQTATATIRDRLSRELDDAREQTELLKIKYHLDLDDARKELELGHTLHKQALDNVAKEIGSLKKMHSQELDDGRQEMKRELASLEGHFVGELAAARMETDLLVRRHKANNVTLRRKRDRVHLAALERSRSASRMASARSRTKLEVSVSISFLCF